MSCNKSSNCQHQHPRLVSSYCMIKHHLQYNSCDHLPVAFCNRCRLVGSSTVSQSRRSTLTYTWHNVDRDTGSLAGLLPYNAKRALECNMIPVEDRTCSLYLEWSNTPPIPLLISLSHSVDAEAQLSTDKDDDSKKVCERISCRMCRPGNRGERCWLRSA